MSGGARSVCLLAAIRSAASEAFLSGVRSLGTRPCVKRQPARVGGLVSRALMSGLLRGTCRWPSWVCACVSGAKLRAGTLLPWTRPPYGYRLDPERPRNPAGVRLDEAEAAVVRDLFAWFADEGATILAMRQRLARLGIAPPRGHRTWNASALHGVLTNPTYLGQIFANRARTRPAERRHSALLP